MDEYIGLTLECDYDRMSVGTPDIAEYGDVMDDRWVQQEHTISSTRRYFEWCKRQRESRNMAGTSTMDDDFKMDNQTQFRNNLDGNVFEGMDTIFKSAETDLAPLIEVNSGQSAGTSNDSIFERVDDLFKSNYEKKLEEDVKRLERENIQLKHRLNQAENRLTQQLQSDIGYLDIVEKLQKEIDSLEKNKKKYKNRCKDLAEKLNHKESGIMLPSKVMTKLIGNNDVRNVSIYLNDCVSVVKYAWENESKLKTLAKNNQIEDKSNIQWNAEENNIFDSCNKQINKANSFKNVCNVLMVVCSFIGDGYWRSYGAIKQHGKDKSNEENDKKNDNAPMKR